MAHSASALSLPDDRLAARAGPADSDKEDEAQAEALELLKVLGQRNTMSGEAVSKIVELEHALAEERRQKEELRQELEYERARSKAAQQQVICLEYELDSKEAALQVVEHALEQRDQDLERALAQQQLQNILAQPCIVDDGRFWQRVLERKHDVGLKESHIAKLVSLLPPNSSKEDDAVTLSSGVSTTFTTGSCPSVFS
jgi:hypothetical protein